MVLVGDGVVEGAVAGLVNDDDIGREVVMGVVIGSSFFIGDVVGMDVFVVMSLLLLVQFPRPHTIPTPVMMEPTIIPTIIIINVRYRIPQKREL